MDTNELMKKLENDEIIEGTLTDQWHIATLSLKHENIDM
jgi:hypothetical protein